MTVQVKVVPLKSHCTPEQEGSTTLDIFGGRPRGHDSCCLRATSSLSGPQKKHAVTSAVESKVTANGCSRHWSSNMFMCNSGATGEHPLRGCVYSHVHCTHGVCTGRSSGQVDVLPASLSFS